MRFSTLAKEKKFRKPAFRLELWVFYYTNTDEIPGFFLLLKSHIVIARGCFEISFTNVDMLWVQIPARTHTTSFWLTEFSQSHNLDNKKINNIALKTQSNLQPDSIWRIRSPKRINEIAIQDYII